MYPSSEPSIFAKVNGKRRSVDAGVLKEIDKLPDEMKNDLAQVAMELGQATGGSAHLDVTKLSTKQRSVLKAKSQEVRKMDDLVEDKAGNLVDRKTGAILVDAKLGENLVKDAQGNLVDAKSGRVIFDKSGGLQTDKDQNEKIMKAKEGVKQQIIEENIKEAISSGDELKGFTLDANGELKQVSADGQIEDYIPPKIARMKESPFAALSEVFRGALLENSIGDISSFELGDKDVISGFLKDSHKD
jgi:hypothetical protein